MSERREAILPPEAAGQRLDKLLADLAGVTRSAAVRLIESDLVTINGKKAGKNTRPIGGETLEWMVPDAEPDTAQAQQIPLDIVYEDSDIIVINKPVGMVVHPAAGNREGTLVNALLWHCGKSLSGIGGVIRPGIVHRIDKDTSGLLVVAKNDEAHLSLAAQIKKHKVSRVYLAVALGNLRAETGTIQAPIGRHPTDRKRMAVIENPAVKSRSAVTHWSLLANASCEGRQFSLVRCELETGRTHQIRVHLSSIGHPLLGDAVYGGGGTTFEAKHRALIAGQCLHAGKLTLTHPRTGDEMEFFAPPPREMQKLIAVIFGEETAEAVQYLL
ncbi:MAG: RluA family pseudouridine synthase [Ruminococcaceae bacterium]|nr:RluA family pseudouridine synthase [Oscillospiraceae bacterium]